MGQKNSEGSSKIIVQRLVITVQRGAKMILKQNLHLELRSTLARQFQLKNAAKSSRRNSSVKFAELNANFVFDKLSPLHGIYAN